MATLQELEAAFIKADDSGNVEDAKAFAAEITKMRSGSSAITRTDKVVKGLRDPVDASAQLLTKILPQGVVNAGNRVNNFLADKTGLVGRLPEGGVDQQVRDSESQYQAKRAAAGESGFDGYRMLGNVVNPVNLGLASRIPQAASLGGKVATGAITGAALGGGLTPATSEDSFGVEKAKQMAAGGVTGGAFPLVAGGLARVVNPNAANNPNVQLLRSEGVNPTVGQTLGGLANMVEQKAQSLPIMGGAITSARNRAKEEFNQAAINRAVAPIGQKATEIGREGVRRAGDALSQSYDDALAQIKAVKFDNQFKQDFGQLKQLANNLTPAMKAKFNREVKTLVEDRISPAGSMIAETFKKAEGELGKKASDYASSATASERELGDALKQAQSLLQQTVARQNPQYAKALAASDEGWANLVRVEGAAKAAKNSEGVFTPAQLNTAIQTADKSVRKRAVGRGTALMQDLGSAGQAVLGSNVPNSGTADRLFTGLAMGGLPASYLVNPLIPAAIGGGLLTGAAAYTSPAQKVLNAIVASRPELAKPVAEAIRKGSPILLPGASLGVSGLLNQ